MTRARSETTVPPCPCGSGRDYDACCGRFHAGAAAPDAEALMRSRYCAYVREDAPYLLATWHPTTRPAQLTLGGEAPARWLGLQVRRHVVTGVDTAIVEFVARYRIGNRAQRLHETSRFVREDGHWHYLDGEFPDREGPS
jgi:SEC-C motif-containing protein